MNICKRHVGTAESEKWCVRGKENKNTGKRKEKKKEKNALSRTPQDVNALKVCGLNQGHFMNASDYMSVCQSTRKVNNPFVVGWFVGWLAESCCLAVELVWLSRLSMCPLLFWYLHIAVVRALHRWYVYALYCVCSRACVCVFTVPKIDALLTLPHFSLHTNVCDMFLFASSSSSSVIFGWFSVGSLKTYHMFFIRFKKFDTPNAYVWMLLDGNGSNLAIWWFNRYVLGAVGETNCSVTLTAFDAFSSNKRMCLMCTIPFDELHLHANGICMFQQKLLPKWKGK